MDKFRLAHFFPLLFSWMNLAGYVLTPCLFSLLCICAASSMWNALGICMFLGIWPFKKRLRFLFHKGVVVCAIVAIRFMYRVGVRPWLSGGCRFYPTCSAYSLQAFSEHTILRALYLTLRRIVRCHPWGRHAYDPVPSSLFSSRP